MGRWKEREVWPEVLSPDEAKVFGKELEGRAEPGTLVHVFGQENILWSVEVNPGSMVIVRDDTLRKHCFTGNSVCVDREGCRVVWVGEDFTNDNRKGCRLG